jgi:alpha-glucosidase (family GH31 glycosyl hydrolase)
MSNLFSRRDLLKGIGFASAYVLASAPKTGAAISVGQRAVEIAIAQVSRYTVRLSLIPRDSAAAIPDDGSLIRDLSTKQIGRFESLTRSESLRCGDVNLTLSSDPLTIAIQGSDGGQVQKLRINQSSGSISFSTGAGPVFGLGEGGPQFDRRGSNDPMRSGQGGYKLRTHGGRVPVQWLIGAEGWAIFVHQPYGSFDLRNDEGRFDPAPGTNAVPIDLFVVASRDPSQTMKEYAGLTGHPEMPPLWSLGYQQSHRTLAGRDEVVSVARTFREKKLPCDALIYLGTGFTPSGWNTANGSFSFNPSVFSDPKAVMDQLHSLNFRVVLHAVILARSLRGSVRDRCELAKYDEEEAGCYWNTHRKVQSLGVDGWWPDEGDPLDAPSRLARNRMYYEGPQLDRPNQRPYALHRNGHAGMQRYAAFLWSGDVFSTWETLRTHVAVAINTGLSGIPYWGTDIGGFVPTKEYTGELHVRWFQFGAFCPLFRAHGRTWHLRLPWGWNTGELGPNEIANYTGGAANPDPAELHNAQVEPICRKYLELRYRLMPYLYTAVREAHDTGLPIMRALWIHYPNDPSAVARGDQYLWGRDILVAPVTESGARSRRLYLPGGGWYDFWTEEKLEGGREIERPVDLATIPLFVRSGSIVPLGPVKQHTGERVDEPLVLTIYPGADGLGALYEDDGATFNYRSGDFTKLLLRWDDARRQFTLRSEEGSRLSQQRRRIDVRIVPDKTTRSIVFEGRPIQVQF